MLSVPIRPTIVNYDGCFVDTTNGAMNVLSGIFSVSDPGIYQLSFTAKYVSSNRGRFGAWSDIYVNQTVRGQCKIRTPVKHNVCIKILYLFCLCCNIYFAKTLLPFPVRKDAKSQISIKSVGCDLCKGLKIYWVACVNCVMIGWLCVYFRLIL